MRLVSFVILSLAALGVEAQQAPREEFLRQQAFAEMQRVTSRIDTLQSSFDDLQQRVSRVEQGGNTQTLQAEVASLRASVSELRSEMARQREEIVRDLMKRINSAQAQQPAPPPKTKPSARPVASGPTATYEVIKGDTLSLIAKAFNTSVSKLCEMNGIKSTSSLRIGQKLVVPQ